MFSLIDSKISGQHRGKFRGLLQFSLSNEAGIYCCSTGKTKSETGKGATYRVHTEMPSHMLRGNFEPRRKWSCPLYPRKRTCAVQLGMSALGHSGHGPNYSITSSARLSKVGDTTRSRVFAVFRLIISSYLVGACTGKSAGFSPFRMRSI